MTTSSEYPRDIDACLDELRGKGLPGVVEYTELERSSRGVTEYDAAWLIPGLLQHPDYTRAVLEAHTPEPPYGNNIDLIIETRLARQREASERGLTCEFLIGDRALKNTIGTPEVMERQFATLLEKAEESNVSVRILGEVALSAVSKNTPNYFVLFWDDAGMTTPSSLFTESSSSKPGAVDASSAVLQASLDQLNTIRAAALSAEDSRALIERIKTYRA